MEKIKCYWDTNSEKYQAQSSPNQSLAGSISKSSTEYVSSSSHNNNIHSNSWYVSHSTWSEEDLEQKQRSDAEDSNHGKENGIKDKIQLIKNINREEDDDEAGNVSAIVDTAGLYLSTTSGALYAENWLKA